jgi:flagellar biogenesis protein FliO
MMIAMKPYILLSFFLGILCLQFLVFAQENPPEHSSDSYPTSNESFPSNHQEVREHKNDENHADFPEIWSHQLERESDTFQVKFFNMLLLLGLLIGFMILASWALKRLMKTKMTNLNTASYIKILDTRYLSPRATVYLIEVQDKAFLIAESPTAVTYLASIPLEDEHTSPTSSSESVSPTPFTKKFP